MGIPHERASPLGRGAIKIVRSAERIGIPETRERKSCQSGRMAKTRGSEAKKKKKFVSYETPG